MRCLLLVSVAAVSCLPALADVQWTQPTPDELKMTSDPKAPDAPAEYLNLELWSGRGPFVIYARIKIFNEKGREEYSDIRMDYVKGGGNFGSVEGRTVQPDGTVVPFTGKPYDKELVSFGGFTRMEKVFSMPDVQIGSILEFRAEVTSFYGAGGWYIQQPLFIRKGHFHYASISDLPMHTTEILPPGAKLSGTPMGGFDLTLNDVPALPDEEYSLPLHAMGYRVLFLYTYDTTAAAFWKDAGKEWSGYVNDVTYPNGKLKDAVDHLLAPGDTDLEKLQKIYAAVMNLENTDFTRERTKAENKAQKVRIKTANDIWTAQRGDGSDHTLLFITMARAAKFKAYAMAVTDRSEDIFQQDVPSWTQLDDLLAIVEVDGKEMFFDPGERYCEFGKLKWTHTWSGGVRQTASSGAELSNTPVPEFADTDIVRKGSVQVDADLTVHGTIQISMTGNEALRWRQDALRSDEEETKKKFEKSVQSDLPPGIQVKMASFAALADDTQPLVASLEVSGTLGTRTGHRILLPGSFFEAQAKPPFSGSTRQSPVYMRYPYMEEDSFKIALPPGVAAESLPQDAQIPFVPNGDFVSKYRSAGAAYAYARRLRVANILYDPAHYGDLRSFFQRVSAQDQEQLVLKGAPAAAAAAGQ